MSRVLLCRISQNLGKIQTKIFSRILISFPKIKFRPALDILRGMEPGDLIQAACGTRSGEIENAPR